MIDIWREGLRMNKPRWVILVIDLLLMAGAFVVSFVLIFKERNGIETHNLVSMLDRMLGQLALVGSIYLLCFLGFQTYRSVIRRTGIRDLQQVAITVFVALVLAVTVTHLIHWQIKSWTFFVPIVPFSDTQLLFHAFITGFSMSFARVIYRALYHELLWNRKDNRIPVILFGAGNMGNTTFNFIQSTSRNKYRIVAIMDDNPTRIGKRLQGFKIHDVAKLDKDFVQQYGNAHELIIATDRNAPERLQRVVKLAEPIPLIVKIIPDSARLMAGEVATRQIRSLRIEDLLGRKTIDLDNPVIQEEMCNKVVLITGGAGSIGSELVRQIGRTGCAKLIVLDQAESALYEVQQELQSYKGSDRFVFVVGNIRNEAFMQRIFEKYSPQYVFHAAAYKHVPLMEANPYEAVMTNVWGSCNVAQLADRYGVEKFVMVSTDKAVNPTNVMGATKRVAEIIVSCINKESKTNYIVTRFGNVLGSNGSVIPLFEKQMLKGGPLTITHPDITRYFMTIPEACQLVQEAGVMGAGGEVFVFDMGQPVKIMDLAKQMIRLKGYNYPEDIDIKVVGLRPGEKIFEELLANGENTEKTHHEKIMIAKVNPHDIHLKKQKIVELCELVKAADPEDHKMELVRLIKDIVPEFKSQNSVFERLDS
ncbi:NDP-sugar epimerase, includes UDP-GlcNAc-inverting 4,6-dehydratase FlaA1 and capsular polysaccharide biosynthesis protein EpsC [Sphingobacterium nematocida]|uniref:NDP-sugar epimerase, includes UDP-GlcNAc-inverting 4,6-dehydratase FlaA1 and capsular polysaccharide biosynthesis protein EpsC n=2 Tax=Sphingobacterium nematocida TaxID=1513896 RepID=A0A1T5EYN1_9SPHI|nr:NDP-sugar epimerase, includes UDP-GlcNAc-inverting 4,6-dehydratase FlaA1 and capsular polysaccharide biosynthesis protein EpsC [Sphingobacterium nematocida]